MEQRRAVFLVGLIGLIIIALILGTIFYLSRVFQRRGVPSLSSRITTSNTSSPEPSSFSSPAETPQPVNPNVNTNITTGPGPRALPPSTPGTLGVSTKTYLGQGYHFNYPASWGILTCTNSTNYEFDPENHQDQKVACDFALKPITVLTQKGSCTGSQVKLGNVQVIRGKVVDNSGTAYEWCIVSPLTLDITERVSPFRSRANSQYDYSIQVEQMISSITPRGT